MFQIKDHRLLIDSKPVAFVETKNRGGNIDPKYIVLHDTASPVGVKGDIDWLAKKSPSSSAHFVVGRDGGVTQLAATNVKTWHAGASKWRGLNGLNGYSIGIEIDNPGKLTLVREGVYRSYFGELLEGPDINVDQAVTPQHGDGYWATYTREQVEVVAQMCGAMIYAYDIKEIITHYMISPGRKVDVNPLFPLDRVREMAFGNNDRPATPPIALPQIVDDATVTGDGLRLRAQPFIGTSNIICELARGTRVDVQEFDKVSGWVKVIVADDINRGKTGFVSARFVDLD